MRWRYILATIPMVVGACSTPLSPTPIAASNVPPATAESAQPVQAAKPIDTQPPAKAPTPRAAYRSDLPDLGLAPELANEVWLNTARPLRLSELRGKVVVLDMWTFGCINCRNVIPSLRDWYEAYSDQGLVIIGNHFPEFDYERDLNNLTDAVHRLDVPYAVAQDNAGETWTAYRTRYWPTLFLIDKNGHVRYTHIGEGAYTETESAIQALLKEDYRRED